jgi:plasmid maintenance system antidote protein VapI
MALRIGKMAGNGPGIWLRMQQHHDLWYAEQALQEQLDLIRPAAMPQA